MVNWLKVAGLKREPSLNGVRGSSVLVCVTGSSQDHDVVQLGCELLESNRSTLFIAYVIEVPRSMPVDAEVAAATLRGEQVLGAMEEVAGAYNCGVETQLIQARKTGVAVVRQAVDKEVDAIVMGASATESFGLFSLGEHIPYVMRHAPCRVIVSRDPIPTTAAVRGYSRALRAP